MKEAWTAAWGGANCCQGSLHCLISITRSQLLETSALPSSCSAQTVITSSCSPRYHCPQERVLMPCFLERQCVNKQDDPRWAHSEITCFWVPPKSTEMSTQTWTLRKTCRPADKSIWSCIPWKFKNVFIKKMAGELTSTKLLCVRNGQVLWNIISSYL